MGAPMPPDEESFVVSKNDLEEIVDTAIRAHEEEAQKAISIHKQPLAQTGVAAGTVAALGVSPVSAGAVATACAPALAPLLAVAFAGQSLSSGFTSINPKYKNNKNEELNRCVHQNVKNTVYNLVIKPLTEKILSLKTPNTKISNGTLECNNSSIFPIEFTNSSDMANAFKNYCDRHGSSNVKNHDILHDFLNEEFSEGFKALEAAQNLRDEFRLTPKPPENCKWGQRKKNGQNISLDTVLGEYAPDLPGRNRKLSELDYKTWWNAFYKEDAGSGKISIGYISKYDNSFYDFIKRNDNIEGGIRNNFGEIDFSLRDKEFTKLIGANSNHDLGRIRAFMTPGNRSSINR